MSGPLDKLSTMEYAGRVIIIGRSADGREVVMYAITGRSPSSQARRLEMDESGKRIFVKPTDEETLKTGQPDLLVYSALLIEQGIGVGNGKQTDSLRGRLGRESRAVEVLMQTHSSWEFEPDEPNYTPRISGCITKDAALCIIKRAEDGSAARECFEVPMAAGKGKMIATYTGVNEKPLPSFAGEPLDVEIPWSNAAECADAMYEALGPAEGQPDFRVVAAAVYLDSQGKIDYSIKNRHDL